MADLVQFADNGVEVRPREPHTHACFCCDRLFINCTCNAPKTENFICGPCDSDDSDFDYAMEEL